MSPVFSSPDGEPFAFYFIASALNQVEFLPVTFGVISLERKFGFEAQAIDFKAERSQGFSAFAGDHSEGNVRCGYQKLFGEPGVI